MRGPVVSVTCHDPDRPDLAARLRTAATDAGLIGSVSEAAGSDGAVAVLEIAVGDLGLGPVDGGEAWRALSRRLGAALDAAVPTIALGAFGPVLDLDDPAWGADRLQWCSGRVDVVNEPVLWCWTDGDSARLAARLAAALPDHEVDHETEYGALSPVVLRPPAGRVDQADLLADLRTAVVAGAPAWAGLLPLGGFLPPGVAPEVPESGVVDHVWLRRDWAGELLPAVADALSGAPAEEVADGVLFVTGPDPRGADAVEHVWTPMVRYQRLVAAASLLGERLRSEVAGPETVR